ncbi:MAG TPA: hypothetical protein VMV51_15405, partial [Gemmatimonadaceae bacterium]|nr:hypothetical protein [Gemmatimonadaceae bacterium]
MDAREQLRRYLEQRREMGDSEMVLDSLSVEEAMRVLGAGATGPGGSADWRAALTQAGATPDDAAARVSRKPAAPPAPPTDAAPPFVGEERTPYEAEREPAPPPPASTPGTPPAGLAVGSSSRELFTGQQPRFATLDDIAAAVAMCTQCALSKSARNP